MSLLHTLTTITTKPAKRLGRGYGSGKGSHTVGRGNKGQTARVGSHVPLWFEGGQLPLIKRLPMWRGKGRFEVVRPTARITLGMLSTLSASEVSLDTLKLAKVIDRRFKKAKVVATGTITKAVKLKGILCSQAARAAIEKAGGGVE